MTKKQLVKKIVALIPSPDMRRAAVEQKYVFGEKDLLKLVNDYCAEFEKRLMLLDAAAELFEDKSVREHAKKLAAYERKSLDLFVTPSADAVYEVFIKFSPADDDSNESYITRTFDDAVSLIKLASARYKDIGFFDNPLSDYTILKKTTVVPKTANAFGKLFDFGQCKLGYRFRVKRVEGTSDENEFGKPSRTCLRGEHGFIDCENCKHVCMFAYEPTLPVFLEKYDLAAFIPSRDLELKGFDSLDDEEFKRLRFCIIASDPNDGSLVVVIPLDGKCITERDGERKDEDGYYEIFFDHEHICTADLIKPDTEKLPDGVYDDYLYAAQSLKNIDKAEED